MVETIVNEIVEFFNGKIPGELTVFLISLLPILECRGALIAAKLFSIPWPTAFIICYIGNILPIPFILIFIKKIFAFMKKHNILKKFIEKLEVRSMRQSSKVEKASGWGLLAFVALPLPGTGGWTGALIAALMDMKLKKSLPIIMIGVLIASFIMTLLSYGVLGAILG